jgi:hypothetical protein
MATQHLVKLAITLKAVHSDRAIPITVGIDQNLTQILVKETEIIHWEFLASDTCKLTVTLPDKTDQEAVIVENVSFFGIEDPKFAWAGVYEPVYPEPWATEQQNQGVVLKPQLCPHTYLGWSGKWTLTFDVPVFTWIHKTQNLGWIYG